MSTQHMDDTLFIRSGLASADKFNSYYVTVIFYFGIAA